MAMSSQLLRSRKISFLGLLVTFWAAFTIAAWAEGVSPRTFLKSDYPLAATQPIPHPNVLFLLDTGSPMVFSPKGIMPLQTDNYSKEQRAGLLKECSYGSGGRPLNENAASDHSRYGRDLNDKNNKIGDPNCYYSPDPQKPYFLTFKDARYHKDLPSGVLKGSIINQGHPRYAQLVPNDSRMYMMKLVLWRLTGLENAQMFSRMNVGMATSYQEDNVESNYIADYYKRPNWGKRGAADPSDPQWGPALPHGSAPEWSLGFGYDTTLNKKNPNYQHSVNNYNYRDSQKSICGIWRDLYERPINSPDWRRINRSVLKVPFDRFYVQDTTGNYVATKNLGHFRAYIDGIETSSGNKIINPELFADGQTPLSTSLYARPEQKGKDDPKGKKLIQYAPQKIYYGNDKIDLTEFDEEEHTERLISGQAVGSVIDFFSPLKASDKSDGLAFSLRRVGYFPISDSCQDNWVVIFTAGNDESNAPRTAAQAALELYKNTQGVDHPVRGRARRGGTWVERDYAMEKGVRTLVVGFVDPKADDDNSKKLRESLNSIAAHGQPKKQGKNWVKDETKQALFANDVPALIRALEDVFKQIDSERREAPSGSPILQPNEGGGISGKIFSASYTPKPFDQWLAAFSCRKVVEVSGNRYKTELIWEAGKQMQGVGLGRPLYVSEGTEGSTSLSLKKLSAFSESALQALSGVPNKAKDFGNWLLRPVATYNAAEPTPLGDMQNSNFLAVGSGDNEVVYLQTNRGVLHALNAETGREIWGFIPPNVLQGRSKVMKYEGRHWYNGDGKEEMRSMPISLLDGALSNGALLGGGRILLGTLGYGGNGLYAMDISNVRSGIPPSFLWAVDNIRYEGVFVSADQQIQRWGNAAVGSGNFDYGDLGMTFHAVSLCDVLGAEGAITVGILPGGLGYKLGMDSQGKAIFVLNPRNGEILKKLDNAVLDPHGSKAPMGMAVAPLTFAKKEAVGSATGFLTADTEGNVLNVDIEEKKVSAWRMASLFRLTTVAASGVVPGKSVAIPKALLRLRRDDLNQTAIIGATCDVFAPGARTDSSKKVHNDQQFIFCIRQERLTGSETTKDLFPLTGEDVDMVWEAPGTLSSDQKGWYLRLKASDDVYEDEYATTRPVFSGGRIVVTTFRPKKAKDVCVAEEKGRARIYRLDIETGKSLAKPIDLDNVKIVEVTETEGGVALAVAELESGAMKKSLEKESELIGNPEHPTDPLHLPDTSSSPSLKVGVPYVDYWRDIVYR